ncbi:MAG: hypothetical protein JNK90_16950 [Planctomycetaceae bacterium]|nr:hypothetical protein [Planctomycetaceae bacterium]
MRADRDKEIALADADLQKQLTGNESAHTTAVNNANSAHSTATATAEAARKSAKQAALTQLNSTVAQAAKDKEASIAGAERTYDQAVASLDAQYGSASSNGDTGVEGATRRSAIKTRDAQYYAARDTSWANTLSGSTTLGTSPWTVKAITAANGQAAFSVSRASAQAAHDAAMLDAMEDWQEATSTATLTKLAAQANGSETFNNAVSSAFGDWEEFLGNYSTYFPDELVLTENATVSFSPEQPMVQSPNIPIPGGPDELGNSTPTAGELPGRPLPKKRSWITGEGTWLSSPDDPTTEDRTWWQFGGELARTGFELTPGWQFNELIQSANERYGKPGFISELAHGIDGSTHNVFNVFSFGASDYVGATDSESFHYDSDGNATVFYYQSGIFTISRELLMLYGTMSVRAALLGSKGFWSGSSIAQSLWSNLGPRNLQMILRADMAYHAVQTVQGALALPADFQAVYNNPTSFQAWWGLGTNTTITTLNIFGLKVAAGSKIQGFDKLTKQAPSSGLYRSQGITVAKEGGWFVKSVDDQASSLMQYWGRLSIEAQHRALQRLSKAGLAPEYEFANGVLRTADVGPALATGFGLRGYLSPTFWRSYVKGSYAMRTLLNDIRPRNMSSNGIIFDPAWDPITKTIWAAGIPTGIYVGIHISDYLLERFGYNR